MYHRKSLALVASRQWKLVEEGREGAERAFDMLIPHLSPLLKLFTSRALMRPTPLVKPAPCAILPPLPWRTHNFNTPRLIFSTSPSKLISNLPPIFLKTCCLSYTSNASIPRPVRFESSLDTVADSTAMKALTKRLKKLGFGTEFSRTGEYRLLCPTCKGGDTMEKSLSLNISPDRNTAVWFCHRATCGSKGTTKVFVDVSSTYRSMNKISMVKQTREMTEETLKLEPPCGVILGYFAERIISKETLQRNSVRQKKQGDQIAIAFPYRRNGVIVSCKYRTINRRFWQEKDTEKIFYGLDDIKDASDIIIVEGEMDKLAMEEAGFRNCVSVPDGAPQSVSNKELPPEEKDTKYRYLWNCKDHLEKASRIILATDGDRPGQALAEELARRLGRGRCCRVRWPKKNDVAHFKDANEVLMFMGPGALREVIESAELYPIRGLFNFRDYFDEIDSYYHQKLGTESGVPTGGL